MHEEDKYKELIIVKEDYLNNRLIIHEYDLEKGSRITHIDPETKDIIEEHKIKFGSL